MVARFNSYLKELLVKYSDTNLIEIPSAVIVILSFLCYFQHLGIPILQKNIEMATCNDHSDPKLV